jgi:hypothetical protein
VCWWKRITSPTQKRYAINAIGDAIAGVVLIVVGGGVLFVGVASAAAVLVVYILKVRVQF